MKSSDFTSVKVGTTDVTKIYQGTTLYWQKGVTTLDESAFSFTLSASAITSAGVFKPDGTLVRTLWGNKQYAAGTHVEQWNGQDDFGVDLPTATYEIKVLSNNVQYEWEGVVGNTSDNLTGSTVLRSFSGIADMVIHGTTMYYATNYNEGWNSNFRLDVTSPQSKVEINKAGFQQSNWGQSSKYVTTDGNIVYWSGNDPHNNDKAFVFGTNVSNDAVVLFSSGVSYASGFSKVYTHAIDLTQATGAMTTGIAVQQTGNYLFVAHGGMNEIHVLNKTTGAAVRTITTFTNPRAIEIDGNDNLWVVSATTTVAKYTVNADGTLTATGTTITGLLDPLRLAVSYDKTIVAIIDGSTSQQVKAFSNSTGAILWTLGQVGGYQSDPTVFNDKFYFVDRSGVPVPDQFKPSITFQPDGSFWVGDGGNYRLQHFSATRTFIETVAYLGANYSTGLVKNDSTRVFNAFMEYSIDYSKPLDNGKNGSWTLVRNWRDQMPLGANSTWVLYRAVFENLVKMSNGRTYGTINNSTTGKDDLFELTSTGTLRNTGISYSNQNGVRTTYQKDGSRIFFQPTLTLSNPTNKGSFTWTKYSLTGFDGSNNPLWGTGVTLASVSNLDVYSPFPFSQNNEPTSDGKLIVFDNNKSNYFATRDFYHLAGIKLGDTKWTFRTAKSTFPEYSGPFPKDGTFDIGNTVIYPGGVHFVEGSDIFWGYHGEFWKNGQTNVFEHFHESGLMVGMFGPTSQEYFGLEAYPGGAGNVFSGGLVKMGNTIYMYTNDESAHAGIHRWKVTGLNTVQMQTALFPSGQVTPAEGTDLLAGLQRGTSLQNGTLGWSRNSATDYTINANQTFTVTLGVKNYDIFKNPDLFIQYVQPSGSAFVSKSLGNNAGVASWRLWGKILLDANSSNEPTGKGGSYIEVLDNADKVIARFFQSRPIHNIGFFGNDKTLISSNANDLILIKNAVQPFEISATGGILTFTYGPYVQTTTTKIDSTAVWNAPTTLRFYYFTNNAADNVPRGVSVHELRFVATS